MTDKCKEGENHLVRKYHLRKGTRMELQIIPHLEIIGKRRANKGAWKE